LKQNKFQMIPVSRPLFIGNEKKYLNNCIEDSWVGPGKFNEKFEISFAKYIGKKYAISVSNGSNALDLAIASLRLKKGDEIIVTNFTIISCISAIIRAGAKPVLVDIDNITWNFDINQIEQKITPKTKAIMAVHIYNFPIDMIQLEKLSKKYNLKVIEDCAEQIGQNYNNKKIGSYGDISCFSFYSNKNITTGEGGMILTDDISLYKYCKKEKNLGFSFDSNKRFIHDTLGYNYRMTNMQAAVGLAQLEKIEVLIQKRKKIGRYYSEGLKNYNELLYYPPDSYNNMKNIYWVFAIRFSNEINLTFKNVSDKLFRKGIETRPFFLPIHKQPIFNGAFGSDIDYPNSNDLYSKGIYLPCGNGITLDEARTVLKELKVILNGI